MSTTTLLDDSIEERNIYGRGKLQLTAVYDESDRYLSFTVTRYGCDTAVPLVSPSLTLEFACEDLSHALTVARRLTLQYNVAAMGSLLTFVDRSTQAKAGSYAG